MRKEPMTPEAKKARRAAYMKGWLASLPPERKEALNAKRRGKWVPTSGMSPAELERKRKSAREHMRRKISSMSIEDKAAYLARRRSAEVPRQRERRASSPELMEKLRQDAKSYYWRNREKQVSVQRAYRERCKQQVFDHYGRSCACCGEDELVFLTLDHVNGDGAAHRKSVAGRSGFSIYTWIVKNNYPEGFQALCFNCNAAKRTMSECPHRAIVKNRFTHLSDLHATLSNESPVAPVTRPQ